MSVDETETDAANRLSIHAFAEMATPFDQPYGGPRWPQKEGYTIWECIVSSTEASIRQHVDAGDQP